MTTSQWLRELGAVRPMAPASDEVLVLGKWHDGHYPIRWERYMDSICTDANGNPFFPEHTEQWRLFGCPINGDLSRESVERILKHLEALK